MKQLTILIAAAAVALTGTECLAQKKSDKKDKTKANTTATTKAAPKYSKTAGGLEYIMINDAPGGNTAKIGDNVEMHIKTYIGDSILFDSRKMNNNQPVPFQIMPPSFKGDLVEGFMLMSPGDSAVFRVSVDSLKKAGATLLPWMKKGDKIDYEVAMISVKSKEEMQKEMAEKSAKQVGIDEKLLQDYFTKNNLSPKKTASGLYYKIDNPGAGDPISLGQSVTVDYTGKTMDGTTFDSNVDPAFNHVQPFTFSVGLGQVIKGWDEGLMLLKKGGKATFYIPSGLAYGDRSPSNKIPANSILIFDVEVKDVANATSQGNQSTPAPKPTPAPANGSKKN